MEDGCEDGTSQGMSWFECRVVAFRQKHLQKSRFEGWKDNDLTLRWVEFGHLNF